MKKKSKIRSHLNESTDAQLDVQIAAMHAAHHQQTAQSHGTKVDVVYCFEFMSSQRGLVLILISRQIQKKKKKKKKKTVRFFFFFFSTQLGQSEISDNDMKLVLARAAAQRKFIQEMSALRQRRRLGALQHHAPFCTNDELVVALAQCEDDDDDCALRLARPSFVARVRELCSQRTVEPSAAVLPRRNLRTNARALFVRGLASLPPKVRAPLGPRLHSAVDADGKPRLKGFFIASEIQNSSTIEAVCSAVSSTAAAAAAATSSTTVVAETGKRKRAENSTDENESEDVEDIAIVDSSNTSTTAVVMNRESGRLCLDDAVRRAHAGSYDGWSDARKRAFKSMNENPNAYYYRFNAPGEEQKNGHWSPDEEKLFFEVAKQYPVNTKWGLFSIHIPGRVGYQCSNFYRQLVRTGRIKDPNYVLDETGRPRFLFKNKHGDKGVRDYKKIKESGDAEGSAEADNGANAAEPAAAAAGGGGQVVSRKRLNGTKPPKPQAPLLYDADGNVILRKRGRPRKYPLPGQPLPVAATPTPPSASSIADTATGVADTATTATTATTTTTATTAMPDSTQIVLPPPPLTESLFHMMPPPPIVAPVSAQTSSETYVVAPVVTHSAAKPLTTMMLFEAPFEPVLLVNKETTTSDDAAVPANDAANEPSDAAEAKSARVRKVRVPVKPKKKRRGKGMGDVIFADDVDDTLEVTDFKPSMRMRSAFGVENPLPDYVDPITMLPVVAPMMSPAGIVLGKETWLFSLAGKSQCPLTKQPCTFAELTLLTKLNIERLRARLRL
jgi:hypothetical protein